LLSLLTASTPTVTVPVRLILDGRAKWSRAAMARFWSDLWPEAVQCLARGGVRLDCRLAAGELEAPEGREPIVLGLDPRAINFVVTHRIPREWDLGRAWSGVATMYRGHVLCVASVYRARGNEVPFLSVNTCLHELLHALSGDVFETRPGGVRGGWREARIDWLATRLWLFGDGSGIRDAARACAARLQSTGTDPSASSLSRRAGGACARVALC
jgi:hypothetical protein